MNSYALKGLAAAALVCSAGAAVYAQQKGAPAKTGMMSAAKGFLATLDADRKAKATFAFDSDERLNWHFIPKERKGLPLKQMTQVQREAALKLLSSSMSEEGYNKAATIRELEKILLAVEKGTGPVRDPEQYFFSIFGEPSETGTWGWRYEGHHCAQNWTIANGKAVASSPQFFGTNPGEVRVDVPGAPPRGTRALGDEENLGRKFVLSLSEDEKKTAILSPTAPPDIITGAQRQAAIQDDRGIAYSSLSSSKQKMLMDVVYEYVNVQAKPLAEARVAKLKKAGLKNIKFAWMGGTEVNQPHYYRIQGPTFLIEYDNTQNNANHVHAVWRDFKGDFGMDLLAMHYQGTPHRVALAK